MPPKNRALIGIPPRDRAGHDAPVQVVQEGDVVHFQAVPAVQQHKQPSQLFALAQVRRNLRAPSTL